MGLQTSLPDQLTGGGVEVPAGLAETGTQLWEDVTAGRKLSAPHATLLLNICRIADRLDDLVDEIDGRLTTTNEQGTENINPLISEHRQQLATMSMLMQRLGIGELPKGNAGAKTLRDQIAEQRKKREAKESTG